MIFNKLIEAPMDIKQQILSGLLVIVSMLMPCVSIAQTLSSEETAFLKSLNGKWNRDADYSAKWGTWCYDMTLRYVNGTIKVSYPAEVFIKNNIRSVASTKVTDAVYNPSSQKLDITYKHHILDLDEEDEDCRSLYVNVSLSIPFQTDIEDTILVYSHDRYSNGYSESKEVMYYKH